MEISIDASLNNLGISFWKNGNLQEVFLIRNTKKFPKRMKKFDIRLELIKERFLFVKEILLKYNPEIVYLESPTGSQNSSGMLSYGFEVSLNAFIQALGYKVLDISPMEAKKCLTSDKNATKEDVMKSALQQYPEILSILPKEFKDKSGNPRSYCEHIFDSIAIYKAGCLLHKTINYDRNI